MHVRETVVVLTPAMVAPGTFFPLIVMTSMRTKLRVKITMHQVHQETTVLGIQTVVMILTVIMIAALRRRHAVGGARFRPIAVILIIICQVVLSMTAVLMLLIRRSANPIVVQIVPITTAIRQIATKPQAGRGAPGPSIAMEIADNGITTNIAATLSRGAVGILAIAMILTAITALAHRPSHIVAVKLAVGMIVVPVEIKPAVRPDVLLLRMIAAVLQLQEFVRGGDAVG